MAVDSIPQKEHLHRILSGYDSLLVAFSAGVDSTLLLAVAAKIIPKVVAVTVDSPFFPRRELRAAEAFARRLGIPHVVVAVNLAAADQIAANTQERCYHCKQLLFQALKPLAKAHRIETIADGANRDDLADYRPGLTAARELGVIAPFIAAGMTKADIRSLSREMDLETWQKPAMACLATRIPYGTPITRDALERIERAEEMLQTHGFASCRVRDHGPVARIEVAPDRLEQVLAPETRADIVRFFREIGYLHVCLDLEGYAPGRMNRAITG